MQNSKSESTNENQKYKQIQQLFADSIRILIKYIKMFFHFPYIHFEWLGLVE